jgi:hypothetical protein
MSPVTCDGLRAAALDPASQTSRWTLRPDLADHLRRCGGCRDWLDAFSAGDEAWAGEPPEAFAASVLARTSGAEAVLADLPLLSEMDPGPGFTERVLAATSRRLEPAGWAERARLAWQMLVRRPRFAWEAAYVATVCWVLVFGNPVSAIEWGAANLGTVARERLSGPVQEIRADLESWRARLEPPPAASAGAPAGSRADDMPPVVRAWQAATDWLRGAAASLVDVLARAWAGLAAWLDGLAGEPPPSIEPAADPARSSR